MEETRKHILVSYRSPEVGRGSLAWPLLIAVVLHLLLYQLSPLSNVVTTELVADRDTPIVIDALDEKQRRPVVTTSRSTEDQKDATAAPFHSDIRNRVKEQTRAPLIGKFQEGMSKRGAEVGGTAEQEGIGEPQTPGEIGGGLGMHELMPLAKTPHALSKDIREGGQTVLNTDKVLYASFINRIAEEIYEPWVAFAQEGVREVMKRGRKIEPTTYITKLNVVMNQSGEVVAMTLMEGSTLQELDDAPKKAFWKISRFPNPPSQLIDGDGLIRLNYEFHFEWKSSFFNIVPYQI